MTSHYAQTMDAIESRARYRRQACQRLGWDLAACAGIVVLIGVSWLFARWLTEGGPL
jgi:hypothetical protein